MNGGARGVLPLGRNRAAPPSTPLFSGGPITSSCGGAMWNFFFPLTKLKQFDDLIVSAKYGFVTGFRRVKKALRPPRSSDEIEKAICRISLFVSRAKRTRPGLRSPAQSPGSSILDGAMSNLACDFNRVKGKS